MPKKILKALVKEPYSGHDLPDEGTGRTRVDYGPIKTVVMPDGKVVAFYQRFVDGEPKGGIIFGFLVYPEKPIVIGKQIEYSAIPHSRKHWVEVLVSKHVIGRIDYY